MEQIREGVGAPITGMELRGPVLVVDDHLDTVEMFRRLLETNGHRVVAVSSALVALALMKKGLRPAVILTDERMPYITGTEMLQFLRGHEELRATPVLVLSAQKLAQKGDPLTVVRRKPMEPQELLDLVDRMVQQRYPTSCATH